MNKAASSSLVASVMIVVIGAAVYLGVIRKSGNHPVQTQPIPSSPKPDGGDGPIAKPEPANPAELANVDVTEPTPKPAEVQDVSEAPTAASLVRLLELDPDKFMLNDRALRMLRSMGADAVPDLRRVLRHATPAVRWTACWTLEILESRAHAAVPDLVNALEDSSQRVQEQAAQALGAIGAAAADAIPKLTALGENYRVEPLNDIARVAVDRIREALDEEED